MGVLEVEDVKSVCQTRKFYKLPCEDCVYHGAFCLENPDRKVQDGTPKKVRRLSDGRVWESMRQCWMDLGLTYKRLHTKIRHGEEFAYVEE